jgi:hypothetical protein
MKKVIILILAALCLGSCKRDYGHETTIVYNVYFPGNTVSRTYTFDSSDDPGYILASDRGSNYLVVEAVRNGWFTWAEKLENTSAPIEVVSFRVRKK